jgi:hypothetical protein
VDSGRFTSVPAWFTGFQALENRFLFPGDGEVSSEESLDGGDVRVRHRGTSFRLNRKIVPDTGREKRKNRHPRSRDERCHARGTTPLRHSLAACDLNLCGSVVVLMLRHSGSDNGEPYPSPPTEVPEDPVRSETQRAFSPAFPIPLLS